MVRMASMTVSLDAMGLLNTSMTSIRDILIRYNADRNYIALASETPRPVILICLEIPEDLQIPSDAVPPVFAGLDELWYLFTPLMPTPVFRSREFKVFTLSLFPDFLSVPVTFFQNLTMEYVMAYNDDHRGPTHLRVVM